MPKLVAISYKWNFFLHFWIDILEEHLSSFKMIYNMLCFPLLFMRNSCFYKIHVLILFKLKMCPVFSHYLSGSQWVKTCKKKFLIWKIAQKFSGKSILVFWFFIMISRYCWIFLSGSSLNKMFTCTITTHNKKIMH